MLRRVASIAIANTVATMIACSAPTAVPRAHEERGWSASSASSYLQRRSTLWLDSRPCALSCHTTHPFVLVGDEAGGVRARVLERVRDRVRAWPDITWWYTSDADKVAESRGTEAVLNAFALAGTADAKRALDIMFDEQRPDGGWSWLDFGLAPWELSDAEIVGAAFAVIAVMRSSYEPPAAKRTALVDFIRRKLASAHLHDQLTVLWAASYDRELLAPEQRAEIVAAVVAAQRNDGGFALADFGTWRRKDGTSNRSTTSEGYATAFAAYVLSRVDPADSSGHAARARRWLAAHQDRSGAWLGVSLNDDDVFNRDLMSDAATAFAVLVLRDNARTPL